MANTIAFTTPTSGDGITGPLWTIEADGSSVTEIAAGTWHTVACSASKIAAVFFDGLSTPDNSLDGNHLKIMDRDGSNSRFITAWPVDQSQNLHAGLGWSPSNQHLALAYNDIAGLTPEEGILIVEADNSSSRKVSLGAADASHITDSSIGRVLWSIDGRRFIYTAYNTTVFATRRQEIRFCAQDGSGVTVIATGPDGTDWYLLDVFKDGGGVLAKKVVRSSGATTWYKVGFDGLLASLYSDPSGSFNSGTLAERDAALSPNNNEILFATHGGLSLFSLTDGSLTSIYSTSPVYRVSWDPPLVQGFMNAGPGLSGLVRY